MRISGITAVAALVLAASIGVTAQRQGPGPGQGPGQGQGPVPLPELTLAERQAFDVGARTFAKNYTADEGLGPVFNDESCNDCHRGGGGSNRLVARIGRIEGTQFDGLVYLGGSLLQSRGVGTVTTADGTHDFQGETVPVEATIVVHRRSQPLFGLGLVDAVPDETFTALAEGQQQADPSTAGRVQRVFDRTTGAFVVGRFGWKAQVPTLRQFAGDALLNEVGITSPGIRDEVCPQGNCLALGFNPAPFLNDDGRDAEAMTDFMRMLAPLPRNPVTDDVLRGESAFEAAGCAVCHQPALETGPHAIRELDRMVFHPYSDCLLHDMGALGDGLVQESAGPTEMRTAPLLGLRLLTRFLHDGSAATIEEAIQRHGGQGRAARRAFDALSADARDALLAFLRSL